MAGSSRGPVLEEAVDDRVGFESVEEVREGRASGIKGGLEGGHEVGREVARGGARRAGSKGRDGEGRGFGGRRG